MSDSTVRRQVVVLNPQGLHLRPASEIAKAANRFEAKIELVKQGERADAKSILAILTLAAVQGTELWIEAEGLDALSALDELAKLVCQNFAQDNAP